MGIFDHTLRPNGRGFQTLPPCRYPWDAVLQNPHLSFQWFIFPKQRHGTTSWKDKINKKFKQSVTELIDSRFLAIKVSNFFNNFQSNSFNMTSQIQIALSYSPKSQFINYSSLKQISHDLCLSKCSCRFEKGSLPSWKEKHLQFAGHAFGCCSFKVF